MGWESLAIGVGVALLGEISTTVSNYTAEKTGLGWKLLGNLTTVIARFVPTWTNSRSVRKPKK